MSYVKAVFVKPASYEPSGFNVLLFDGLAVGATREHILRRVLSQAAHFSGMRLAAGVGMALLGVRVITSLLYDTGTTDPLSACIAIGSLALAAALATIIPAIRTASANPNEALRAE